MDSQDNRVYGYFFDPDLRDKTYACGDVYDTDKVKEYQELWKIDLTDRPYLKHVKKLSDTWPHLRLLADFMEIGTTPLRWEEERATKPNDRPSRTKVTRLDFKNSREVKGEPYEDIVGLRDALKEARGDSELRLWVVEDLSRDVIEALGHELNIEPAFFREHIVDYAWYNIRDRWADPPSLNMIARRQRWLQMRFARARYFKDTASFQEGADQTKDFNVYRRLENDLNNKATWDLKDAVVGITRTKASFWLRGFDGSTGGGEVGVLLLDPTIRKGTPLWYGYRNWEATPRVGCEPPAASPRDSLLEAFTHWAKKPSVFPASSPGNSSIAHVPIQALLHLVCAEWLTMAEYIKSRLSQIEWEVSMPEYFLDKGILDDVLLKKLHYWRRVVPVYRELLTDTIQRVSNFSCHRGSTTSGSTCQQPASNPGANSVGAFCEEFDRALSCMNEYQERIDRLTSVVTGMISIQDARREQANNRNVARITLLATFFVPLSLVASIFSMQQDVTILTKTYRWYFAIAVPVAALTLFLGWVLTRRPVLRFGRILKRWVKVKVVGRILKWRVKAIVGDEESAVGGNGSSHGKKGR